MRKSKLVRLIDSLSNHHRSDLLKYIESKNFCTNPKVSALLQYLLSRKYFSDKNTAKRKVFDILFPNEKYSDLKLRHLMNISLDFILKNVRLNEKKTVAFESKIQQIKYFREHNLTQFGLKTMKTLANDVEKLAYRDESYYLSRYRMEVERFEWIGQEKRLGENNVQELSQDLNHFYIIATLKYACISLTHQNLKKGDYQFPLLNTIVQQIEDGVYVQIEAIMLYYYAYMALKNNRNDFFFQKLKSLVLQEGYLNIISDQKEVLMFAINYCIKRLNSGDNEYIREAFELYMHGLEQKILLDKDATLSRFTFKNVIALGLRLKEFGWAHRFIQENKKLLAPEFQDSQVNYNTARLFFYQGIFDKAIMLLQQAEFDDVFMNMDAKIMLLKMYFQEKNMASLEALLNSFEVYLHRKKILAYHKDNYKNIIRYIRRIISLQPYDNDGKRQLVESIERCRPLTEKQWLLNQL